jgi:hypothetical protein
MVTTLSCPGMASEVKEVYAGRTTNNQLDPMKTAKTTRERKTNSLSRQAVKALNLLIPSLKRKGFSNPEINRMAKHRVSVQIGTFEAETLRSMSPKKIRIALIREDFTDLTEWLVDVTDQKKPTKTNLQLLEEILLVMFPEEN